MSPLLRHSHSDTGLKTLHQYLVQSLAERRNCKAGLYCLKGVFGHTTMGQLTFLFAFQWGGAIKFRAATQYTSKPRVARALYKRLLLSKQYPPLRCNT